MKSDQFWKNVANNDDGGGGVLRQTEMDQHGLSSSIKWLIGIVTAFMFTLACSFVILAVGFTTFLVSFTPQNDQSVSLGATEIPILTLAPLPTMTPVPTSTPLPNPQLHPGEIIRHYKFDGDDEYWPTESQDDYWLKLDQEVKEGKYRWTAAANKTGFFHRSIPVDGVSIPDDYQFSVDVRVINGSVDAVFGLVFSHRGDNYWVWQVSEDGSGLLIEKRGTQWMNATAVVSSMPVNRGGTNTLTVKVINDTVQYYVNGWQAGSYTLPETSLESKFDSYAVGLSVNLYNPGDKATVEFDDVIISRPE